MYKAVILCAFFFVLCEARIKVNITVGTRINNSKIEYEGEDNKPLSDLEIKLYDLTNKNLLKELRALYHIKTVNEDPSLSNDDIYKLLRMSPVERYMEITKARIIHVDTKPKVILITYPGKKFPEPLNMFVDGSINFTWSGKGIPDNTTQFNVRVIFDEGIKTVKFDDDIWGKDIIDCINPTSSVDAYNLLKEGIKTLNARLVCDETIFVAEIEYSAKLIGTVMGNNRDGNDTSHYEIVTVSNLMKAANMTNEIIATQRIEIQSCSESKLKLYSAGRYKELNLSVHVTSSTDLRTKLAAAGNKLVVLFFMATSCKVCQTMETKLNEMSSGIVPLKVDVDQFKDIATEYKITSVPTFVFMKNSKKIEQYSGTNIYDLFGILLRLVK